MFMQKDQPVSNLARFGPGPAVARLDATTMAFLSATLLAMSGVPLIRLLADH